MPLQAYVVVFSSHNEAAELPEQEEIKEACTSQSTEDVDVNMWPVTIEELRSPEGHCRNCGQECEESRLFCDNCSDHIVDGKVEEEE